MFYNKLRPDFKRELILHVMKFVKKIFLLALNLELSTSKIREQCSSCEEYERYAYKCPLIKYSKCGEFEHNNYQCSSKSQHIDNVQIEDINNSSIVENVHIPPEVTRMLLRVS